MLINIILWGFSAVFACSAIYTFWCFIMCCVRFNRANAVVDDSAEISESQNKVFLTWGLFMLSVISVVVCQIGIKLF